MRYRYPKCDRCERKVPQVIERVIKRKRVTLCFSCAEKAGWFQEEKEEPQQGQLFEEGGEHGKK